MTTPSKAQVEALTRWTAPFGIEGGGAYEHRNGEFILRADVLAMYDAQADAVAQQNAILRKGIDAVNALINESRGVAGLHLNGDVADWPSLLPGGRYEEWLADFSEACKAMNETPMLLHGELQDEPVTDDWFRSIGGRDGIDLSTVIGDNKLALVRLCSGSWQIWNFCNRVNIDDPASRTAVLNLLAALGITAPAAKAANQ